MTLVMVPLQTPDQVESSESLRIGQASFFLDSILQDMDRSLSLATKRALTSATNYVIVNEQPLRQPGENISSALINGTISGEELENMENVSIDQWTKRVSNISERSSFIVNLSVVDYSYNSTGFGLETSYRVNATLRDPVTFTTFNRSNTANATIDVSGIEDPMILLRSEGRYTSKYSRCPYDQPLQLAGTGTIDSNGTAYGRTVYKPSPGTLSSISDRSSKILVVENVDSFSSSEVNDFRAVAGEQPNSSDSYTTEYVFDAGKLDEFEGNRTAIVHRDEVWRSELAYTFEKGCYFPSSEGPDPLERLGNKPVGSDNQGIATMIDVAELPTELQEEKSAVGYVYFDDSRDYGPDREIVGVTGNYSWFRLDQTHVDRWSAESIAK